MIKELVQFTESISDLKDVGLQPKYGLYIQLRIDNDDGQLILKVNHSEVFGKKTQMNAFFKQCASVVQNTWMVNTNKCFDKAMGIHSCSPYCVAFKKEFLKGGGDNAKDKEKNKRNIPKRFTEYFESAEMLLSIENEVKKSVEEFKNIFVNNNNSYQTFLKNIESDFTQKRGEFEERIKKVKEEQPAKSTVEKEMVKRQIEDLEIAKSSFREIEDADYIVFFFDTSLDQMKDAHSVYLGNKLFNTDKFNVKPKGQDDFFGTSDFFNGFGIKKPFLMHKTATFDISGRISGSQARDLDIFKKILSRGILPNPLPILIYEDEQKLALPILKEFANEEPKKRMGFQEIIKRILESIKFAKAEDAVGNYYLLNWKLNKGDLETNDFDFVSQFNYKLEDEKFNENHWQIYNLLKVLEETEDKKGKKLKTYRRLENVFDLQTDVFAPAIGDKFKRFNNFFDDLKAESYSPKSSEKNERSLNATQIYRQAIYDFIYKSRRECISANNFREIMLAGIFDDLKYGRANGIKNKLNIYFSLNHNFDFNNSNFNGFHMPDKYQKLMTKTMAIADSTERIAVSDKEEFAFISGQMIDFLLSLSESSDQSHAALEGFLQKTNLELFKLEIARILKKYKHKVERWENLRKNRVDNLMREIMLFDEDVDMSQLLIFVLGGYFSPNFFYTKKEK